MSIHSARENSLVSGLIMFGQDPRPSYIGVAQCNNTQGCQDLTWLDGSPAPYQNFQQGEECCSAACLNIYYLITSPRSPLQRRVLLCCESGQ